MTAVNRHRKALNWNHKAIQLACFAGLGLGAFLGIPPFMKATGTLIGGSVDILAGILSDTPLLANGAKAIIMGGVAMMGYNCWKSSLEKFPKYLGLGMCATLLYNVWEVSPPNLSAAIVSLSVPVIGTIFWVAVNAAQVYVWSFKNDESALRKVFGKLRPHQPVTREDGETDGEYTVKSLVGRNRTADAFSSWMVAGLVAYVIEIVINIYFSKFFAGIDWGSITAPGYLAMIFLQFAWGVANLFASVGLVEYCLNKLDQLETLKESVEV